MRNSIFFIKITLSILLFLCSNVYLSAQTTNYQNYSPYTYIYKISPEEAADIYQKQPKFDDAPHLQKQWLYSLVDSVAYLDKPKDMPAGHYIFVNVVNETVYAQLRSYTNYQVEILNNQQDLALVVYDSAMVLTQNAQLSLDKEDIPFDTATQSWRLNKQVKGGFLIIQVNGETLFYDIRPDLSTKLLARRWQRFKRTTVGKIFSYPARLVKNLIFVIKNKIQGGGWYNPFKRRRRNPKYNGYVMLNKPKFQPGDTLKLTAYLTKNKKAIKQSLHLNLRSNKTIFQKKIKPTTAGNFQFEMVMTDSLDLDKTYYFTFKDKKYRQIITQTFQYEDYQLDEVIYSFSSQKNNYFTNEKVVLEVTAKDYNGFAIPDGRVHLLLQPQHPKKLYAEQVWLPDTLWNTILPLDAATTSIIVPDSLLPAIKGAINATAWFTNSNGELQKKFLVFSIDKPVHSVAFELENGLVKAYPTFDKPNPKTEATLSVFQYYKRLRKEKIVLPFEEKANPFATKYELEYGNTKQIINLKANKPDLKINGQHRGDSLLVNIENPAGLKVRFDVFKSKQKIASGETSNSFFQWKMPASPHQKSYYFRYHHIWGNQTISQEKQFDFYKKLLTVEVQQAPVITPGETVEIKVKVTDSKNKAVPKAQIAASAINAQFPNQNQHYKNPKIQYKFGRRPLVYNTFKAKPLESQRIPATFNRQWYERLNLDTLPFYQFRFPEYGVIAQYDSITTDTFYKNVAQFAPYLVSDGRFQPIYMIYCNRQLVYYYDCDDEPPYSFVGQEGYNTITLRTTNQEFTIDSILLKKGHKLELIIDQNKHSKWSNWKYRFKVRTAPKELSAQEKRLLYNSMFVLRRTAHKNWQHLWQDETSIHRFKGKNNYTQLKIGPFQYGQDLYYLLQGGFYNKFKFEGGFSYDILAQRERLYQDDRFQPKTKIKLPLQVPLHRLGETIYTPSDIQQQLPPQMKEKLSNDTRLQSKGSGQYFFDFDKKDVPLFAVVLEDTFQVRSFYHPHLRSLRGLAPQTYKLYLFAANGDYISHTFSPRPDTLLMEDLNDLEFVKDSTLFYKWFYKIDSLSPADSTQLAPPLGMTQQHGGGTLKGTVMDESGEMIIFGNVTVFKNGNLVTGTTTDFDGNFMIEDLAPGVYDVEASYVGYASTKLTNIYIAANDHNHIDITLATSSTNLEEIVVVAYKIPLIEQDNTTQGGTLTSDQIARLPTRNINAIAAKTVGVSVSNDIRIRGTRTNAINYYVDGIRVSGNMIPEVEVGNNTNTEIGAPFNDHDLRSNFEDVAFFEPSLVTDQHGEVRFMATFPDNITEWKTTVLSMNKKQQAGTGYATTKAFKTLVGQLAMPRFLIAGDETDVVGKSLNFSTDTFDVKTTFKLGDKILQEKEQRLETALIEKVRIHSPENADSLTVSYLLHAGKRSDGEQRSIPIFPKGVEESNGHFWVLNQDTTFTLPFQSGDAFQFYAQNNVLEVLLKDLKYLQTYPYACTEQTSSRLMALLLEKELRAQLGEVFEHEDAVIKMVQRLRKMQNDDGSWGWWRNGKGNNWMTVYALRTLHQAKLANYETVAYEKGLRYLTQQLPNLEGNSLLNALRLLADVGQNLDYEKHLTKLDSLDFSLYEQFSIIRIRQLADLDYSLDSLNKYRQETVFGSHFWGEDNYRWYNNATQVTLLAYEILKTANKTALLDKVCLYFLEKRRPKAWRNTFETAQILSAILPHYLNKDKLKTPNEIQLSGGYHATISEFPAELEIQNTTAIQLTKTGNSPMFVTAFQQHWNEAPSPKTDLFELTTTLYQNDKKVTQIEQGKPSSLKVEMVVKKAADYMMLEIPIPAGCSYEAKPRARFPAVHQEYFKEKVAVFYERITAGTYVIEIPLEPRFAGQFSLNLAKAEQMYFPVFYGRNGLKEVKIDK